MSAALIWSPFESEEAAAKAVSQLLDEGLIACANLIPGMRSLYVWRGERGEARECGALLKTEAALLDKAVGRLAAIHPYDTPAIAGWRADAVPPSTAAWLGELV
jgi:periplasmic divalent cation tolerance protein